MGRVRVSVSSSAPAETLYEMGRGVADSPHMFPNMESLRILERSEDRNYMKAVWTAHARLLGISKSMSWTQEDRWDEENLCCRFGLSPEHSGVINRLSGVWSFERRERGSVMVMDTDVHMTHPIITPRMHRLVELVLKFNNEAMLKEIKKRGEAAVRDAGGKT